MTFEPVAIVGQACLLPGAHSPEELWSLVLEGRTVISHVPGTRWRADRDTMLSSGACVTDRGGFVEGFERIWTPGEYPVDPAILADLDPLFHWLLHVGRGALLDANVVPGRASRTGAIVGNLGYPTEALIDLAQAVHIPDPAVRMRGKQNRFSTGFPVHLMCEVLGLEAGGFALDAACASSLYALRLACDWLHSGRADCMLAGGVSRCDSLLIHSGFTALHALSPTGQSRPFHRDANGLIPAEGAALLVLRRLADAEAAGERILGVIRGIGLSNDGRASGILTPAAEGQIRAMKSAFAQSEISPRDISLVECHATGTPVGDAIELQSMGEVFAGADDLVIGSLKANLGHLITASGAAGVIKVLAAMRHGVRPASPNAYPLTGAFEGTPFRVPQTAEAWQEGDTPRRAAVSSFGFGGNNAHLLIEEYIPKTAYASVARVAPASARIAVVAMAAQAGDGSGTQDFVNDLLYGGRPVGDAAYAVNLPSAGLVFPPRDLDRALAQQTLFLRLAGEALETVKKIASERTAVLAGIQCDTEGTRPTLKLAFPVQAGDLDGPLDAARVIGCMPNVAANRVSRQYHLAGPGFAVFGEQISGIRALEIAMSWLSDHEVDAAVVGACDLAAEPVHRSAVAQRSGDAGIVLVLKREADARCDGDRVIALLDSSGGTPGPALAARVTECFGDTWAASGLLAVGGAIAALDRAALPVRKPWLPGHEKKLLIEIPAIGNQTSRITVSEPPAQGTPGESPFASPLRLETFQASTWDALRRAIRNGASEPGGDFRLAIVASSVERSGKIEQALSFLENGAKGQPPEGIVYGAAAPVGKVAFVFTGAAAAYPGMGRDLLLAFPELAAQVGKRCARADSYAGWVYETDVIAPTDFQQLCGSSFLCQIHAEFTSGILGLRPEMAIGLSSGETNALYALGAWDGMGEFLAQIEECGLYTRVLAGEARAVHQAWRERGIQGGRWTHYRVSASRAELDRAMLGEDAVHITIISSAEDFVIGGATEACERVVQRLAAGHAAPLAMELAVHCADLQPAADLWHSLHRRPTIAPAGIRFYSNALGRAYELTSDAIADALTAQALTTVDFPRTIRQAWEDGTRVFIEHGPRNQCTQSIRAVLGDLPHVAVALDVMGRPSLRQALYTAAELWTAGVAVDLKRFAPTIEALPPRLVFPAHPLPRVSGSPDDVKVMAPAPAMAPLLEAFVIEPVVKSSAPVLVGSPGTGQSPATIAAAVAMHVRVSESHRLYVAEMVRMQEAFLQTGQRLLASLGTGTNATVLAEPPLPVVIPVRVAPKRTAAVRFSRPDLERLASGPISEVFGPAFAAQDIYRRQVRMPEPPMLLADRVVNLTGEPNSMGLGSIVTETDIVRDAWYMQHGHMPAGIAIESGQADLLLISWLGADQQNKGDRVYRLLGCDLTFHGSLPKIGETLRYDIHVDGHARSGAIRMFFFHYDCTSQTGQRLTVREGQAGFFSDEELASSEGVLWSAESAQCTPASTARLASPDRVSELRSFDESRVSAFAEGRVADCFGAGFERAGVHARTPCIPAGRMRMVQRVPVFDPSGGPWGRGYLRSEWSFTPDDWFFKGHFLNDPCMPGTLMFEGCVQAMAFYLSALGFTVHRDAWRFEPVPEQVYPLRCRGQATPSSKLLTYEIFVDEIVGGREPALFADVLCTVDGLKAFHCRRLGLRLVPDWPLEEKRAELLAKPEPKPVAVIDGFAYGYHSLLSCALGRASDAFGKNFARFDGPILTPRLPSPPYHFMSRILRAEHGVNGPVGSMCEVEYDVPPDAWYFDANGAAVMPTCVFLEALLQPCGWLASFAGTWLKITDDIFFRNLDGKGKILGEIDRTTGAFTTRLKMTSFSELAGTTIYAFELGCRAGEKQLFAGTAVFGNFPASSLVDQAGIPATAEEREWFHSLSAAEVDLNNLASGSDPVPAIGSGRLRMLDRITGYWPNGGGAGLGRMRAEKSLDASQWFFKAHFFSDPVQPGSLGIEAMIQTLQVLMIRKGLHKGIANPRFEAVALGESIAWAYRGQVIPENRCISALIELLETSPGFARAIASLWVDGKKIYAIPSLAIRIVRGEEPAPEIETLDPARDTWLNDHCPTYTVPALPMMSVVDRLAAAALRNAPGKVVVEVLDASLNGWISFANGSRRLRTSVSGDEVTLAVWRDSANPALSRFDPVARGIVRMDDDYPSPPAPLPQLETELSATDPYEDGELFHGPSFRVMTGLRRNSAGASFELGAGIALAPRGLLNQVLLDGATHGIPNDNLRLWSDRIPEDVVGYPVRADRLSFFGPAPTEGFVRCEVRFAGFEESRPRFAIQWIADGAVWACGELVYALLPKGPIGRAPGAARRAFLRDRVFVPGLGLGTFRDGTTVVTASDIAESDWLDGTLRKAYGVREPKLLPEIAIRQHVSRRAEVHPADIEVAADHRSAVCSRFPLTRFPLNVSDAVSVRDDQPPNLDTVRLRRFWTDASGIGDWPVLDLNLALVERFVRRVQLADPAGFQALHGRPVLYLANHQVAVESLLFNAVAAALSGTPVKTIAKREHRNTWMGQLIDLAQKWPGNRLSAPILFFDRENPEALPALLREFQNDLRREPASLMVHVQGTRARSCREPVSRVSSVLMDLALELQVPVVPVRFTGGLPVSPVPERLEFPFEGGTQDIIIGKAITPDQIRGLSLKERSNAVLTAIEELCPADERPLPRSSGWPNPPGDPKSVLLETLRLAKVCGSASQAVLWQQTEFSSEPVDSWLREFRTWLRDSAGPSGGRSA